MSNAGTYKLPLKPVLLWLVIGFLDVAGGSYLRGSLIVAAGTAFALTLSARGRRSTAFAHGEQLRVRNFPEQELSIAKSDIIGVRGGRGVSDLTCELTVLTPEKRKATKRVVVWAFRASQVEELRELCKPVLPESSATEPSL